jgi:hypothetical protein
VNTVVIRENPGICSCLVYICHPQSSQFFCLLALYHSFLEGLTTRVSDLPCYLVLMRPAIMQLHDEYWFLGTSRDGREHGVYVTHRVNLKVTFHPTLLSIQVHKRHLLLHSFYCCYLHVVCRLPSKVAPSRCTAGIMGQLADQTGGCQSQTAVPSTSSMCSALPLATASPALASKHPKGQSTLS